MLYNYLTVPVRSSAILTDSYVAGTIISNAHEYDQLIVRLKYTKGSLTSLEVKIEYSQDGGTTYFQDTNMSVSGGTSTLSANEFTYTGATGNIQIEKNIACSHIKISVKGTGTVTNSLLEVTAVLTK